MFLWIPSNDNKKDLLQRVDILQHYTSKQPWDSYLYVLSTHSMICLLFQISPQLYLLFLPYTLTLLSLSRKQLFMTTKTDSTIVHPLLFKMRRNKNTRLLANVCMKINMRQNLYCRLLTFSTEFLDTCKYVSIIFILIVFRSSFSYHDYNYFLKVIMFKIILYCI